MIYLFSIKHVYRLSCYFRPGFRHFPGRSTNSGHSCRKTLPARIFLVCLYISFPGIFRQNSGCVENVLGDTYAVRKATFIPYLWYLKFMTGILFSVFITYYNSLFVFVLIIDLLIVIYGFPLVSLSYCAPLAPQT